MVFFKGFVDFLDIFACLLSFFKDVFHFLFKDLYYYHEVGFNVIFWCFGCVGILSACSSGKASLQWLLWLFLFVFLLVFSLLY